MREAAELLRPAFNGIWSANDVAIKDFQDTFGPWTVRARSMRPCRAVLLIITTDIASVKATR